MQQDEIQQSINTRPSHPITKQYHHEATPVVKQPHRMQGPSNTNNKQNEKKQAMPLTNPPHQIPAGIIFSNFLTISGSFPSGSTTCSTI
jgi:hypothetical protein